METKNCGNCEHFAVDHTGKAGQCRRNPPIPMAMPHPNEVLARQGAMTMTSLFPPINADQRCGEHSDAPQYSAPLPPPSRIAKPN